MTNLSKKDNSTEINISMLQEVICFIEEHILEELTPAVIAKKFYISTSTLSGLFKIVCGITIMEYIRRRRLTLAAEELAASNIPIIELAYKYSYETPEAFSKAFSRFHGFPPSFVRRTFPVTKVFQPLQITVTVHGGWKETERTNVDAGQQEMIGNFRYDDTAGQQGGKSSARKGLAFSSGKQGGFHMKIRTDGMQYQKEWRSLLRVSQRLLSQEIPFKVDGKTMIFAHGLEMELDKICLTFKWNDENRVKACLGYEGAARQVKEGFKYFDVMDEEMKLRCMFYGECPGADTDEFLYRNSDLVQVDGTVIPVQSLEFYYENAEKDTELYRRVESWLEKKN